MKEQGVFGETPCSVPLVRSRSSFQNRSITSEPFDVLLDTIDYGAVRYVAKSGRKEIELGDES